MKNYKNDFPIFKRKINGKPIIYLDSASTSQKPQQVIDAVTTVYTKHNANIHRGIYQISEEATSLFETTRKKVAKFIHAKNSDEIIFTHNTTHALNMVAHGLKKFVRKGDVILISEMEHHSNHVPWQRLAKETGAKLLFIEIDENGILTNRIVDHFNTVLYYSIEEIPRLKIVALAHVSNVLGTINPIKEIILRVRRAAESRRDSGQIFRPLREPESSSEHRMARAQDRGARMTGNSSRLRSNNNTQPFVVIDAVQSVPHMPVDVQDLDCDFLAFSAHKMLGPTSVGVLWGKRILLEQMEPLLVGSHMIREVSKHNATWDELPAKFEPGTAAIEGVVGLGAAIDYLQQIGMKNIFAHEQELTKYALEKLQRVDGLKIYGPKNPKHRGGVVSFNLEGIHSHDVSQVLSEQNICIRSGHHCAMPLHKKLGAEASSRASFYLYNTKEDVDVLILGLEKVKKIFKK